MYLISEYISTIRFNLYLFICQLIFYTLVYFYYCSKFRPDEINYDCICLWIRYLNYVYSEGMLSVGQLVLLNVWRSKMMEDISKYSWKVNYLNLRFLKTAYVKNRYILKEIDLTLRAGPSQKTEPLHFNFLQASLRRRRSTAPSRASTTTGTSSPSPSRPTTPSPTCASSTGWR